MRNLLIMFFVLYVWTSNAFASPATQYIQSGCANNGDGAGSGCATTPGEAGKAFNSFYNWQNQTAGNKTLTVNMTVYVLGTGPDEFCNGIRMNGWTTTGYAINITPYSGYYHTGGALDRNKYYLRRSVACTATDSMIAVDHGFNDVKFDGIQFANDADGDYDGDIVGIWDTYKGHDITYKNCIFYQGSKAGTTGRKGMRVYGSDGLIVVNSLFYGPSMGKSDQGAVDIRPGPNTSFAFYNNTVVAGTLGTRAIFMALYETCAGATWNIKNNIFIRTGTAHSAYGGEAGGSPCTTNTANNITSDTSSPDGATYQSKTVTFVSASDLHLSSSDVGAKDLGADLSAAAVYPFSSDFDRETRTGSWDAGADEYIAAQTFFPKKSFNNQFYKGFNLQ